MMNSETAPALFSEPDSDIIANILVGGRRFKILEQVLRIGLLDKLEAEGGTGAGVAADELAERLEYNADILTRLLDTLTSMRLLEKNFGKGLPTYKLSRASMIYLTQSHPNSMLPTFSSETRLSNLVLESLGKALETGSDDEVVINMMMGSKLSPLAPSNLSNMNHDNKDNLNKETPKADNVNSLLKLNGATENPTDTSSYQTPNLPKLPIKLLSRKMCNSDSNMNPHGPLVSASTTAFFMSIMDNFTSQCRDQIPRAFDLTSHNQVVDLGGGSGAIAYALTSAYPNMHVKVLELPHVAKIAMAIQPDNTKNNVSFVSGNFFKDNLPKADMYILAHVLHDWEEDKIDIILEKVFNGLPSGGELMVLEKVVNEKRTGPEYCLSCDLVMSIMSRGRERTRIEYQQLLHRHGFRNTRLRVIGGINMYDVILTTKPF